MTEIRVLVGARHYASSTDFYSNVLGFPLEEEWDGDDGRGALFRAASRGIIEVVEDSAHHPFVQPVGVRVAVEVDDVDAVYARVQSAGVRMEDEIGDRPWGFREFALHDPSGLPLVFFTPNTNGGGE
jgi:catechol 2,3-dioxygenase-like lactoylglutathione lyase family enzyme